MPDMPIVLLTCNTSLNAVQYTVQYHIRNTYLWSDLELGKELIDCESNTNQFVSLNRGELNTAFCKQWKRLLAF